MQTDKLGVGSDARMKRGLQIAEKSEIRENEDGSFNVPSQTSVNISYQVRIIGATWVCSCPDFENQSRPDRGV